MSDDIIKPTQNQYRYRTVFSTGRWGVLMEDDDGNSARLLYEKASESAAQAVVEYLQTCRTRKVTSPHMEDKDNWF